MICGVRCEERGGRWGLLHGLGWQLATRLTAGLIEAKGQKGGCTEKDETDEDALAAEDEVEDYH